MRSGHGAEVEGGESEKRSSKIAIRREEKVEIEREKRRKEVDEVRVVAVKEVEAQAAVVAVVASEAATEDGGISHDPSDLELLEAVGVTEDSLEESLPNPRSLMVALQQKVWLESGAGENSLGVNPIQITVDPELERDFGPGATRLAIEYEGWEGNESVPAKRGL